MKKTISILALVALAGLAQASSVTSTLVGSVTFTNKASIDAAGDLDNARDSWIVPSGGTVNAIRVTGSLTRVQAGTFVSEARVRLSQGAGNTFPTLSIQSSTVTNFTGTVAVGPVTVSPPAFTLNAGGLVNFEWFESAQDGTANLPESIWDTVSYDFINNGPVVNGGAALGTLAMDGSTLSVAGSHVAGGLDFFTFNLADGVSGNGYLNLQMVAGATGSMTDTEFALYGPDGNLIATDDDGNTDFFSFLSFGAADPFANVDTDAAGSDGATLPAGSYTLVTGGFNTLFAATVNGAHTPGTNAGTYGLRISHIPTPGSLAFLGLAAIAGGRRRR